MLTEGDAGAKRVEGAGPLFRVEFFNDHIRLNPQETGDWLLLSQQVEKMFNVLLKFCRFLYNDSSYTKGIDRYLKPVFEKKGIDRYLTESRWFSVTMKHRISELYPGSPWAKLQHPYATAPASSNAYLSPEEEAREHTRLRMAHPDAQANRYYPKTQHAATQVNTYSW